MQYTQKKGNTKLCSLQNPVATVISIESQSEKNVTLKFPITVPLLAITILPIILYVVMHTRFIINN